MDVSGYKDALLRKKAELVVNGGMKPLQASMENNTRQGDMADQATGNNEVHIALKLKQTDAKILQAIDEALLRIEKGTFGVCRDCGEPIAEARLNAIPWTRVCITCKEKDPTGDRRGAAAHRKGNLRRVPRLRRADRGSAPQRDPMDPRLHHVQRKRSYRG